MLSLRRGHVRLIRDTLRRDAFAETAVYRRVGLAFIRRMRSILGWSAAKTALLIFGVHAVYWVERLLTWRRRVRLSPPPCRNALFSTAAPVPTA